MSNFQSILTSSIAEGTLLAATLSKRRATSTYPGERVGVRPTLVAGQPRYQFTFRIGGRELHENLEPTDAQERITDLFGPAFEHCHLFTSTADYAARVTPGGAVRIARHAPSRRAAASEKLRPTH